MDLINSINNSCVRMFRSNKDFCMDGVSLRVKVWIMFLHTNHLIDKANKFSFSKNSKLAFIEEVCVPMGFQGVFQSPTFHVQHYVGEGVKLCSRHNLHHTDHMKINKPHIVDLQSEA